MISVLQIVLLVAGIFVLLKGSEWFIDGASGIAEAFRISPLLIGLTVVAIGTSMPEASVSFSCLMKGKNAIAVGDIIGSNIANIFLILGMSAIIGKMEVAKTTIRYEIPYMIIATIVFGVVSMQTGEIGTIEGIVLCIGFVVYIVYLIVRAMRDDTVRKNVIEEVEREEKKSFVRHLFFIVLGLSVVFGSSRIVVDAAIVLAKDMGLTDRVIGLTIVALCTSLPELFTTVAAMRKKKTEIAIGNIIGSNIFNILFVVGLAALIFPVKFEMAFSMDVIVAVAAGMLLWFLTVLKKELNQTAGIVLLLCYVGYVMFRIGG